MTFDLQAVSGPAAYAAVSIQRDLRRRHTDHLMGFGQQVQTSVAAVERRLEYGEMFSNPSNLMSKYKKERSSQHACTHTRTLCVQ